MDNLRQKRIQYIIYDQDMMLYNYQIYFPLMPCQTKIFRLPPNTGKSDYQSCRPILSTFHKKSHTMHNMHIIIKTATLSFYNGPFI